MSSSNSNKQPAGSSTGSNGGESESSWADYMDEAEKKGDSDLGTLPRIYKARGGKADWQLVLDAWLQDPNCFKDAEDVRDAVVRVGELLKANVLRDFNAVRSFAEMLFCNANGWRVMLEELLTSEGVHELLLQLLRALVIAQYSSFHPRAVKAGMHNKAHDEWRRYSKACRNLVEACSTVCDVLENPKRLMNAIQQCDNFSCHASQFNELLDKISQALSRSGGNAKMVKALHKLDILKRFSSGFEAKCAEHYGLYVKEGVHTVLCSPAITSTNFGSPYVFSGSEEEASVLILLLATLDASHLVSMSRDFMHAVVGKDRLLPDGKEFFELLNKVNMSCLALPAEVWCTKVQSPIQPGVGTIASKALLYEVPRRFDMSRLSDLVRDKRLIPHMPKYMKRTPKRANKDNGSSSADTGASSSAASPPPTEE